MKIKKHGNTYHPLEHTCSNCGCVFEYSKSERTCKFDYNLTSPIVHVQICCPECYHIDDVGDLLFNDYLDDTYA